MAERSLERVSRALKAGDLAPAYYLTGDEEMLKDDLVTAIVEAAVDPGARDFNLDVRAAGDLDGEALHALIETPPMLAARRVVVVRGLEQWRRNAKVWAVLHAYLEQPSPTTVLVLSQAAGTKPDARIVRRAEHVNLRELHPGHLRRWVTRRAGEVGLDMDDAATAHLISAVGGDLAGLAMELEKLGAAVPAGASVTAGVVAELVGVRRGETIHDWVDALLERRIPRAVELVGVVLAHAGASGVQLVMTAGTALAGVRLARALLDAGGAPGRVEREVYAAIKRARPPRLRRWGQEAKTWTEAATHWSGAELDDALRAAYEADLALKSTTVSDERGIVTTMLVRCVPRNRAAA